MEGSHRETVKSAINRKQDEPFGSIIVARTILGRKATTKERQDEGIADLSSLKAFLYKGRIEKSRDSESLTCIYWYQRRRRKIVILVAKEFIILEQRDF